MTHFTITPDGPFSLEAASHFGFGPNTGRPTYADAQMKLAFPTDDFVNHAFVTINQLDNGDVVGTIDSDAHLEVVVTQVRRILSLNASGSEWAAVGDKDPVLGAMQREPPRPAPGVVPFAVRGGGVVDHQRTTAARAGHGGAQPNRGEARPRLRRGRRSAVRVSDTRATSRARLRAGSRGGQGRTTARGRAGRARRTASTPTCCSACPPSRPWSTC